MDYKSTKQHIIKYILDNNIEIKTKEDIEKVLKDKYKDITGQEYGLLVGLIVRDMLSGSGKSKAVSTDYEREKGIILSVVRKRAKTDASYARLWHDLLKEDREEEEIPPQLLTDAQKACKSMLTEHKPKFCITCYPIYKEIITGMIDECQ